MLHKKTLLFTILALSFISATTHARRLVVFGDSLSDTGTYANYAEPRGGGRFTTNPGKIWIELVAKKLDLPLEVNRKEGFGLDKEVVGGLNFAQGGARVLQTASDGEGKSYTARPLIEQLGFFKEGFSRFESTDLIFIEGGANDVFLLLLEVSAKRLTPAQGISASAQAAQELINILKEMKSLGANQTMVLNLPALEKTPRVLALSSAARALAAQMRAAFNRVLLREVEKLGMTLVDIYSFDISFNEQYQKLGFTNIASPACQVAKLPMRSSLFCNEKTLVTANADKTYKFADSIHPTAGYSLLVADFILSKLK